MPGTSQACRYPATGRRDDGEVPRGRLAGQAGSVPVASPDPHGVFLAWLPFAVVVGVALVDVLAGPGVGFLPVLSLGPALAAISRPPRPTALIGVLALACAVLLAFYDQLDGSRRLVIALATIAGVTVAGVVASAGRRRKERELADFKAIADAAQQILLRPVPGEIAPADNHRPLVSARCLGPDRRAYARAVSVAAVSGSSSAMSSARASPAARTAAVVLGAFRESAYDAVDLVQIAARDRGQLAAPGGGRGVRDRGAGADQRRRVPGRDPQLRSSAAAAGARRRDHRGEGSAEAGLPLGLADLTRETCEVSTIPLKQGDRLLFYTDRDHQARDKQGAFYSLERSGTVLGGRIWALRSTGSSKTSCATWVTPCRTTPRYC